MSLNSSILVFRHHVSATARRRREAGSKHIAQLIAAEFTPVVVAFRDMCNLFECGSCGGMLKVTSVDNEHVGVRCRCE